MSDIFSFEGRIRRTQHGLTFLVMAFASVIFNLVLETEDETILLFLVFYLITTVAYLAAIVRRFHDLGNSGWYTLLLFIPLVGFVYGLILLFKKGTEGPNQYGEDPTVKMMIDDISPEQRTEVVKEFRKQDFNIGSSVSDNTQKNNQSSYLNSSQNKRKKEEKSIEFDDYKVWGYAILTIFILIVLISAFSSSSDKSEDVQIEEIANGIQLFNDEKYDESFAILSEYRGKEFFSEEAVYCLAYMYGEGLGVVENDVAANKLIFNLRNSSNAEYANWAQYYLGFQYYNGEGVVANSTEAYNKFITAARGNMPDAMLQVAKLYHEGDGTKRDLDKAKYWYEKAAEQGIAEAREALKSSSFNFAQNTRANKSTTVTSSPEPSSISNSSGHYNGQIAVAASRCSLWINIEGTVELRSVSEGDLIEIVNIKTDNPNYYFVKVGNNHGFMHYSYILRI
jgi:uncharacterized membrane protein YhaH (DUF805 family)